MPSPFNRKWRICTNCQTDQPHDGGNRFCCRCTEAIARELQRKMIPVPRLRVRLADAKELIRETKGVG